MQRTEKICDSITVAACLASRTKRCVFREFCDMFRSLYAAPNSLLLFQRCLCNTCFFFICQYFVFCMEKVVLTFKTCSLFLERFSHGTCFVEFASKRSVKQKESTKASGMTAPKDMTHLIHTQSFSFQNTCVHFNLRSLLSNMSEPCPEELEAERDMERDEIYDSDKEDDLDMQNEAFYGDEYTLCGLPSPPAHKWEEAEVKAGAELQAYLNSPEGSYHAHLRCASRHQYKLGKVWTEAMMRMGWAAPLCSGNQFETSKQIATLCVEKKPAERLFYMINIASHETRDYITHRVDSMLLADAFEFGRTRSLKHASLFKAGALWLKEYLSKHPRLLTGI
jgi:hypothetical protein